ncbi:MAG: hypothetical protein UIC49_01650, partial [Paludibacteraceae bacterium]|nr:hypothetical protein [Paludibacteraceae bacterium]
AGTLALTVIATASGSCVVVESVNSVLGVFGVFGVFCSQATKRATATKRVAKILITFILLKI